MKENKRAFFILQMLVITALGIFFLEQNFLIVEARGATISHYRFSEADKVILLIEDFEGLESKNPDSLMKTAGFFNFGSAVINLDHKQVDKNLLASKTALHAKWNSTEKYGGWGKGVGANINLDPETDYVNFRFFLPVSNGNDVIKIIMEEDDNENGKLEAEADDKWSSTVKVTAKNEWQLVSVSLKDFKDENPGGDAVFNVSRKGGLHNIIFTFEDPARYSNEHNWYFDFICLSSGKLTDTQALK